MSLTRSPPMRMSPEVASSSPASILSVVVLPHPEGPSRTTNSPSSTCRVRASTTTVAPNFLVTLTKSNVHQPFTAPSERPRTRWRWTASAKTRIGIMATTPGGAHHAPLDLVLRHAAGDADGERHRRVGLREREREQEFVPRDDEAEDGRRGQSRRDQRQDDAAERAETRVAVHARRLFQLARNLAEKAAHHPDDERQVEGRVDDDERRERVEQAQVAHHQKERDDRHDRREHPRRENPQREPLVQAARGSSKPRQRVGRERPQRHERRAVESDGHDRAVQRDTARTSARRRLRGSAPASA